MIEAKLEVARERLARAIHMYNPAAVFALLSGGHDSLAATIVASTHPRLMAAVHNTGIGVQATRDFIFETCSARGLKLLEYRAEDNVRADGTPDPVRYDDIVMKHGFPGPAGHRWMYIRLKQRQLKRLERDHKIGGRGIFKRKVLYVSGARVQESERRMAHTAEVQFEEARIWVAPIFDWSKTDTNDLIRFAGWSRNPVVDTIHKSGECLCGAFSKPGELEQLNQWPITRPAYQRIKALEDRARAAGQTWGWEGRPSRKRNNVPGPLCQGCAHNPEASEIEVSVGNGPWKKVAA